MSSSHPAKLPGTADQPLRVSDNPVLASAQLLLLALSRRAREMVIDHWHAYAPNFHMEPLEFYELLHQELNRQQIPALQTFCVPHAEGGIGSAERLYVRLDRGCGHFDLLAAPFGKGFFFSYRYIVPTPIGAGVKVVLGLLIISATAFALVLARYLTLPTALSGAFIAMLLWLLVALSRRKETYYRQDTSLMYLVTVPAIIKELVERVTLQKGAELSERLTGSNA